MFLHRAVLGAGPCGRASLCPKMRNRMRNSLEAWRGHAGYTLPIDTNTRTKQMLSRRFAKLAAAFLCALTLALPFAPVGHAQAAVTDPNPIQIPITAVVPIQVCGNIVPLPGCT